MNFPIFALLRPLLTLYVLLFTFTVFAQKNSLWISTGYNYGNKKSTNINDMTWGKGLPYSLGSGTATQLILQNQPDSSNWTIAGGLNLLIGNRSPARIDARLNDTLRTATLTSSSLRTFVQLGYSLQIRKFNFQLHAGIILPLSTSLKEEINYHDSSLNTMQTSVIKNYFSIGFKSHLACTYQLHRKIHFFFLIDQNLLNPMVRSKTISKYESSNGSQLNDIYPTTSDREIIYQKNVADIRNNKDVLPKSFDKNSATERLSYNQSYSSIGFQIGFRFLF